MIVAALQDIRRLRWSVAFAATLLLASAGIVFATRGRLEDARQENRQAVAQRGDIQARLAHARDEEREIRARIFRYQELAERGILGRERRLDWVEDIAHIQAARRLIDVQYELSPQRPVGDDILPGGGSAGSHEFMASTMRLRMQLLHEGDLIGFLDDLKEGAQPLLIVRDCAMERLQGDVPGHAPQARIAADCTLDWITLRENK